MSIALVAGAGGQLGQELIACKPSNIDIAAVDHAMLDITDRRAVLDCVGSYFPTVILNAAGYTSVDKAETEPEKALAVNADGPAFLAEAAMTVGARLIHVSTNYVFGGEVTKAYSPEATVNPLNQYGRTKLLGEQRVNRLQYSETSIVRAGWLYSSRGNNFLTRMLRLMGENEEIKVVSDQVGTPTAVTGLAEAMWRMASAAEMLRVWHWADQGSASWYEFAVAIYEEARRVGLISRHVRIRPVSSEEFPVLAQRPRCALLDATRAYEALDLWPAHWRQNLGVIIRKVRTSTGHG